ncbi:acyltransferase family protein [Streptomyces sodiiphilus]|uniref:Acyltransferase family protein n=1 Tax=Streptomyces sodiiphilus TaxID=226217 RepID=A0ABN2P829_9ACTN
MLKVLGRPLRGRPVRKASRDPHWDNIRFLSGTLVVTGHAIDQVRDVDGLRWLYVASWAMRVPVFVMVAGYFSSAGPLTPREARRLVESVLVPYLLIGLLHTLQMRWYSENGEWTFHTVNPAWGLWFLLSLLFWRAGLPFLARLRYPLAVSVVVALLAGYVQRFDTTFSLSRTLCFLPFFLLGWKLGQGLFADLMRARWTRHAALGMMAAVLTASWFARWEVKLGWLFMKGPYGQGHLLQAPLSWVPRGAVLLAGMVIALCFIRLVPRRHLPVITFLGAGGLYIYLLHPLVLRFLVQNYGAGWVGPWPDQLALVAVSVAVAVVLASPPVRALARPLVQPRLPWLFRPDDAPADGRAASPAPAPMPVHGTHTKSPAGAAGRLSDSHRPDRVPAGQPPR